jgi:hypothetical protein
MHRCIAAYATISNATNKAKGEAKAKAKQSKSAQSIFGVLCGP